MRSIKLVLLGIVAVVVTAAIVVATTLTGAYRMTGFELAEDGSMLSGMSTNGWTPISAAGYFKKRKKATKKATKKAATRKKKTKASNDWITDILPALGDELDSWANDVESWYPGPSSDPRYVVVGAAADGNGNAMPTRWLYENDGPWEIDVLMTLGGPQGEINDVAVRDPAVDMHVYMAGWSETAAGMRQPTVWIGNAMSTVPAFQLPGIPTLPGWANAYLTPAQNGNGNFRATTSAAADFAVAPDTFLVAGAAQVDAEVVPYLWILAGDNPSSAQAVPLPLLPGGLSGEPLALLHTPWGPMAAGWSADDGQRRRAVTWSRDGNSWKVQDIGVPGSEDEAWVEDGVFSGNLATLVGAAVGKAKRVPTTWKKAATKTASAWVPEDLSLLILGTQPVVPEVAVGVDAAGRIVGYGMLDPGVSSATAIADTDTVYGYVLELDPEVGVYDTPAAPSQLTVTAYPNPFNPMVTVEFTSPRAGYARVTVHDARGAKVATLYDGGIARAETRAVRWDGTTNGGAVASSGVYFVRVQAGGSVTSRKIVLAK